MDLENYRLSEFLEKDMETMEEYMSLLKFLKPVDTKRRLFDLKLRDVQDTKDSLSEGTFEELIKCVSIVEDIDTDAVLKMRIVDFWGRIMSIKKQIEDINHMERVSLTSEHANYKWEAVNGGERMSRFGIYNTLDTLSGGDILKYEAVYDLPYADVFTKLYMNRLKGDLEIEMSQLKTHK